MAELVMEHPGMVSQAPTMQNLLLKTTKDIKDCVQEMKKSWADTSSYPITDDSQSLQRFFAKLELLLQIGIKAKTTLLGSKKDYWNYFCHLFAENKNMNDGIRFVKSQRDLKTSLGKGRAFLRYLVANQRLADTLQHCVMDTKTNREWYMPKAFFLQKKLADEVLSVLYDLNDLQFDLASSGYDLDSVWPTFARKGGLSNWRVPSRSNSIASLSSNLDISIASLGTSLPPDIEESGSFTGSQMDCEEVALLHQRILELESENKELRDQSELWQEKSKELEERCAMLSDEDAIQSRTIKDLETRLDELKLKNQEDACAELSANKAQPASVDGPPDSDQNIDVEQTAVLNDSSNTVCNENLSDIATDKVESCHQAKNGAPSEEANEVVDGGVNSEAHDTSVYIATIESLQTQLVDITSSRDFLQDEVLHLQKNRDDAQNKIASLEEQLAKLAEDKANLSVSNEKLTISLIESETELNSAQLQTKEASFFEMAYQELVKDKSDVEVENSRLVLELQSTEQRVEESNQQHAAVALELSEKIAALANNNVLLSVECQKHRDDITQLRTELEASQEQCKSLNEERQTLIERLQEIDSLREEMAKSTSDSCDLEEKCRAEKNVNRDLATKNVAFQETQKLLQAENETLKSESLKLNDELSAAKSKLESVSESCEDHKKNVEELRAAITNKDTEIAELQTQTAAQREEFERQVAAQREEYERQSSTLREDLSVMSGSVQRREKMWDSVREGMERELQGLRFDLRSKLASQSSKMRELEMLVVDGATKPRLAEQEATIEKLNQIIETLKADHEQEIEGARAQLDDLKQCLGTAETDNFNLRQELQQKQSAMEAERQASQAQMQAEREQWSQASVIMQSDISDLKEKLVQLLRDKDHLWKKSDLLQYEKRLRASYHWMDSSEITKCLDCGTEFLMTLRKHHCRECGRVLCWSCCNNWILTPHSEKKERVCDICIQDMSQLEMASSGEDDDESSIPTGAEGGELASRQASLASETDTSRLPPTSFALDLPSVPTTAAPPADNPLLPSAAVSAPACSGEDVLPVEAWRVTSGAKAAVSWLASTTTALAANVLPPSLSRSFRAGSVEQERGGGAAEERAAEESAEIRSISSDVFDEITPEELSESLLYPLPDPNTVCQPVVKLEHFDEQDSIDSPAGLLIPAGKSCAVPVLLDEINSTLVWQFSARPKTIGFSVTYKDSDILPYESCEVLIERCLVNSHHKPAEGELEAKRVGVYTLIFDNTHSKLTAKKLSYKLQARRSNPENTILKRPLTD